MERSFRLLAVFVLALAAACASADAQAALDLHIDGRLVTSEPALALLGLGLGVAQPLLELELGVGVDDSTFPVVTLTYGSRTATIVVGDRRAVVDGRRVELQVAPEVRAGVLYVPLHLVADMIGLRVDWDAISGTLRLERRSGPAEATAATGSGVAGVAAGSEPSEPAVLQPDPALPTDAAPTLESVSTAVPVPTSELPDWPEMYVDEPDVGGAAPVFGAAGEALAVLHQVDVRIDNGRVVLEVGADKPVAPRVMFLSNPDRLVIDVPEAVLATGWRSLPGDGRIVSQVRTGVTEDGGVRLVAELTAPTGYKLQPFDDRRGFVVRLNQQIRDVSVVPVAGGLTLDVETTGPIGYNVFALQEPTRVVVDLIGATVDGARELPVASRFASKVRVSQFAQDVVRVVVELQGTTTAALLTSRLDGAVEGDAVPGPDGRVSFVLNPLTGVTLQGDTEEASELANVTNVAVLQDGGTEYVLIETDAPMRPSLRRLRKPERLVLDLPGMQVARSLGLTASDLRDGIVVAVRAGQAEPTVSRIVVELDQIAEYYLMLSADGRRAVLALRRSPLAGRTVVVDPGHGGRDPGAVGYAGTYEKDVTLAIALMVAGMLEKAGATVVMTRHEDTTVELAARSALANAVGADAFVSIHADAVGFGRIASGTSTFYFPENDGATDSSLNRRYAEAVHAEVLRMLGLRDRGVHQRAFHVVRDTMMPAALVEVGFIDNPDEEKLLVDPDFQARAAAGIVQGIVRFFSEERQLDVPPSRQQWQLATEEAMSGFLVAGQIPAGALALVPMALLGAVPELPQDAGF